MSTPKKRCKNGTRKNKLTGNCEPIKEKPLTLKGLTLTTYFNIINVLLNTSIVYCANKTDNKQTNTLMKIHMSNAFKILILMKYMNKSVLDTIEKEFDNLKQNDTYDERNINRNNDEIKRRLNIDSLEISKDAKIYFYAIKNNKYLFSKNF